MHQKMFSIMHNTGSSLEPNKFGSNEQTAFAVLRGRDKLTNMICDGSLLAEVVQPKERIAGAIECDWAAWSGACESIAVAEQ